MSLIADFTCGKVPCQHEMMTYSGTHTWVDYELLQEQKRQGESQINSGDILKSTASGGTKNSSK